MNLALDEETQRFIDEQVKLGHFPSPEAVVKAAIADWQGLDFEIDDATAAALKEGEDQIDRGEVMDAEAVRAHFNLPRARR